MSVMLSGGNNRCFISSGQGGITSAPWCDEYGGYWLKIERPSEAVLSKAKAVEEAR